jgi:hypothetical protein
MDKPELATGQQEGGFRFWPAAHPRFYVELGEPLEFSLRAKLQNPFVVVGPQTVTAAADPANAGVTALPTGAVTVRVRPAAKDDGYWLDVRVGPVNKTGVFKSQLLIPDDTAAELAHDVGGALDLTLMVVDSSVVIAPKAIDLGELSISSLERQSGQVGVLGVRKLFGTFRLLGVSSCAFLKFDVQPLIKEKNYLLKIRTEAGKGPSPGRIDCPVVITTDDPRHPSIEVPLKVTFVP